MADFRGHYQYKYFPFDIQPLTIRFYNINKTKAEMIFVPDIFPVINIMDQAQTATTPKSYLFGWDIDSISHYQDTINSNTMRKYIAPFSRFNTELRLKRTEIFSALKVILPLIILIAVLYIAYDIPYQFLIIRILMAAAAIVITWVYHKKLLSLFFENHINIEYVFYGVYVMSFFSILISVIIYFQHRLYLIPEPKWATNVGKAIHPVILFVFLMLWIFN
jgi:hypothetical protein